MTSTSRPALNGVSKERYKDTFEVAHGKPISVFKRHADRGNLTGHSGAATLINAVGQRAIDTRYHVYHVFDRDHPPFCDRTHVS